MDTVYSLILWYLDNKRDLPWRNTRNPYLIWLSEIILQQTRVNQGIDYYQNFANSYPKIGDLADAPEDEVLKKWQGLGYYSRARNLHTTAKYIVYQLNGVFPKTYSEILTLKGVGPYTAAAIASFAYQLPHAAVDGNVSRVLARYFNIDTPINSTAGVKKIQALADTALLASQPDLYNQAIIELGAMVCTPKSPNCKACPLQKKCLSFAKDTIDRIPVKIKSKKARLRRIDYAVLESEEGFYFKKRTKKDIWQGLHDFKEIEGMAEPDNKYVREAIVDEFSGIKIESEPEDPPKQYTHLLSHQRIQARFWKYKISGFVSQNSVYFSVPKKSINALAIPRLIHKYLEDSSLL